MTATITIDKSLDEGVRTLLRSMLEKGTVRAVLTLRRLEDGGGVAHCLVTDPAALAEAVPLIPVMPAQGGQVLSHLTQEEPFKEPVAAVVRPCEVRGFVELIKRNQAFGDNLVLISPAAVHFLFLIGHVHPSAGGVGPGGGRGSVSRLWSRVVHGRAVCVGRPTARNGTPPPAYHAL